MVSTGWRSIGVGLATAIASGMLIVNALLAHSTDHNISQGLAIGSQGLPMAQPWSWGSCASYSPRFGDEPQVEDNDTIHIKLSAFAPWETGEEAMLRLLGEWDVFQSPTDHCDWNGRNFSGGDFPTNDMWGDIRNG